MIDTFQITGHMRQLSFLFIDVAKIGKQVEIVAQFFLFVGERFLVLHPTVVIRDLTGGVGVFCLISQQKEKGEDQLRQPKTRKIELS